MRRHATDGYPRIVLLPTNDIEGTRRRARGRRSDCRLLVERIQAQFVLSADIGWQALHGSGRCSKAVVRLELAFEG